MGRIVEISDQYVKIGFNGKLYTIASNQLNFTPYLDQKVQVYFDENNSMYIVPAKNNSVTGSKTSNKNNKLIGFLLGFFFGLLGLFGMLMYDNKEDKDEFLSGWLISFVINVVIIFIFVVYYFSLIGSLGLGY